MKTEKKTVSQKRGPYIMVHLPQGQIDQIDAMARADGRSRENFLRIILEKLIKKEN